MSMNWRFIKWIAIFFVVLWGGASIVQAESDLISAERAAEIAHARVAVQATNGTLPQWQGATVSEPTLYYGLQGEVVTYVFSVLQAGEDVGYIAVSKQALSNPVLEFSSARAPHLRELSRESVDEIVATQPLYLGALSYFYEIQMSEKNAQAHSADVDAPRRFIAMGIETEHTFEMRTEVETTFPRGDSQARSISDVGLSMLSNNYITGVPDYSQFWYGSCHVGCAPTAMGNVISYWDTRRFPDLVTGSDWQGMVRELNDITDTYCKGMEGWTEIARIASGFDSFVRGRGYQAESEKICDSAATFAEYAAEIDAGRPLVVAFINHQLYGSHGVTGVGYQQDGQYLIVHDNWDSTSVDFFVQYGTGYNSVCFFPLDIEMLVLPTATPTWTLVPATSPTATPPWTSNPSPFPTATNTPTQSWNPTPVHIPVIPATPTAEEFPYPAPTSPNSFTAYLPLLFKSLVQYEPPYPPPATATVWVPSPTLLPTMAPSATSAPTATARPFVTPSPTVLPTTASCYNAVVNGDMESDGAWHFASSSRPADYSSAIVHEGARSLRLGIFDTEDVASLSSAWQDVHIPSEARAATLAVYYYALSSDSLLFDHQEVNIYDTDFNLLSNVWRVCESSSRWRYAVFDVSPYRGNEIRIHFSVFNNGVGNAPTALFIDDVSVQVCY